MINKDMKIGSLMTKAYILYNKYNASSDIDSLTEFRLREDLTSESAGVKKLHSGDDTDVYEVVENTKTIDGAEVSMDHVHAETHEGNMFFISHVFEGLSAGDTVYLRHYGATTKYLNSVLNVKGVGDFTLRSYADTTYNNNGTPLTPIKRKSDSNQTLETKFEIITLADIDVLGIERLKDRSGYGTNPISTTTSGFSEVLESIFAPGSDVLIALTKNGGTGSDFYFTTRFDVYETDE